MTTEEWTKEKMAVMKAFVDGRPIQVRTENGPWTDTSHPSWDFMLCDYRIKPEEKPRPTTRDKVKDILLVYGSYVLQLKINSSHTAGFKVAVDTLVGILEEDPLEEISK